MSAQVRPVTFPNASGLMLFGILHEPEVRRHSRGVILLSPGVKSRVAPHRMYNKIADMLVQLGFPVLRFDFHGLGDSEGTLIDTVLPDLYGAIQVGRYAEDTRRAVDWMRTNCQVEDVVLGGLCGGAITGVFAAVGSPHVKGIFALGLPVVVDGANVDQTANMSIGQLEGIRTKYLKKLLNPSAWLRVLTMQSDFRLLIASVLAPLRQRSVRAKPAAAKSAAPSAPRGNANPHFPGAFEKVLRQACPVLLLFSESDRLYAEFREKFLPDHGHLVEAHADLVEIDVVPQANHVFTFTEWQHDMLSRVKVWMQRRHPSEALMPAMTAASLEPTVAGRRSA